MINNLYKVIIHIYLIIQEPSCLKYLVRNKKIIILFQT
jgi:hypothetical protein